MEDIRDIQRLRKQLNLTQAELAKTAGVSQSLIAKIESGRVDPSYKNARKIWDALEQLQVRKEPLAKELMITGVYTCSPSEGIKQIIGKMKKHEISQLPVLERNSVVGTISESSLLEHVFDPKIDELRVRDVMQPAPPTVSLDTPESAVLPLLRHFPLVVVVDKGEMKGLITKADIIRRAYT